LRLFSFGGYGLVLVVFGAYDSYPELPKIGVSLLPGTHQKRERPVPRRQGHLEAQPQLVFFVASRRETALPARHQY